MSDDVQNLPARPTIPAGEPHLPAPGVWNPSSPGMPEEDEINLLDLFIVLLKHKVMIISVVFLAGIAALVISLQMPNIYRSEATIAPTTQEKTSGALSALGSLGGFGAMIASEVGIGATGSLDQFDVVLKSRDLTNTIIREHNLLPIIFDKLWDTKTGDWKVDKPSLLQKASEFLKGIFGSPDEKSGVSKNPTFQDAYKPMQELLGKTPEKKQNVMRLSFESKDPKMAQAILNYYIIGLSEFLRRQTLEDAAAQQVHLNQQLSKTTDPLLKNRLYELIAKQIEKETLAKIQRYYSFNVIDPAFVPEKKFKPKRAQICMISVVVAFFIAIFLAFFLEYLKNMKTREDPERLANLRQSMRLRNK
ncbi:MAG: Wzz/FepE/Etk N-terminal domain-containing protein [Deltaproteobacteria bacterium]